MTQKNSIVKTEKILIVLTFILIVSMYLDFFLTLAGVARFGLWIEGNHVVKEFLEEGRAATWFLLKTLASIITLGVVIFSIKFDWKTTENKKAVILLNYLFVCSLILFTSYVNGRWIIILLK